MKAGRFIDSRAGAHGLLFGGYFQSPFHSNYFWSLSSAQGYLGKTIMAYRDEIDDGFDAVVFLEER